eukprot:NODE_504_length_1616_cov_89.994895_g364_i0.p1 GENE.NODE_504_length_1616_cov_89.994895_g364_i0~~NODE_504_length_1616_cov_89.994895_g364_i0.p1  ORF type:complete len:269 (-),score=88.60 NODE_504_length_1616_cov_89.994895_g364_i0:244-1050(-)
MALAYLAMTPLPDDDKYAIQNQLLIMKAAIIHWQESVKPADVDDFLKAVHALILELPAEFGKWWLLGVQTAQILHVQGMAAHKGCAIKLEADYRAVLLEWAHCFNVEQQAQLLSLLQGQIPDESMGCGWFLHPTKKAQEQVEDPPAHPTAAHQSASPVQPPLPSISFSKYHILPAPLEGHWRPKALCVKGLADLHNGHVAQHDVAHALSEVRQTPLVIMDLHPPHHKAAKLFPVCDATWRTFSEPSYLQANDKTWCLRISGRDGSGTP